MTSNALKIIPYNQNNTEKEIKQYGEYKGQPIELNLRCNFRPHEFMAIYNSKKFTKDLQDIDVSYFEENFESLGKNDRNYVRYLAVFRRLNLDFFTEISSSISLNNYTFIDSIENFKLFNKYFDKYHDAFDPQHADNPKIKGAFKSSAKLFTLKLWMSGYGLIPGLTDKHITSEFLEEVLKYAQENNTRKIIKFLRFISFSLYQESDSPVDRQLIIKEGTDLFEREFAKWDSLENEGSSELLKIFRDFTKDFFYKRTEGNLLHEYSHNGTLVRETYQSIGSNTFVNYSLALRNMLSDLAEIDVFTMDDALEYGILDVLADKAGVYEKTKYETMKSTIKYLVDIYIKDNNLDLNINRIVPPTISRRDTYYGQALNMSDVTELIEALLDDDCSFYENISLSDKRSRYLCLLMLSTGQRISAHICLAYDCIKENRNGDFFINFHKTKNGQEVSVPATPDILDYVTKLQEVAPLEELEFSTSIYPNLDDLKMKRLVANKFNTGPINRETVADFLQRLQKHIWGEDFKDVKDKVFAPHDFRRIKATSMKIRGSSDGEIAKQLGHSNIKSQVPYLLTKPVEHQEVFAEIYQEGLYSDLYKLDSDGNILLNKDVMEDKVAEISSATSYNDLIETILSSINNANDITIQKVDTSVLEPTGFPVSIYSCNASNAVHCMKSRISCFGCDYYKPDDDSLETHKAEIFRYLLLHKNQLKSLKATKDIMLKSILTEKTKYLESSINSVFDKLFDKFNLNKIEISKIKDELEKKSKTYSSSRTYGKQKPMPSFQEALRYIKEGKI